MIIPDFAKFKTSVAKQYDMFGVFGGLTAIWKESMTLDEINKTIAQQCSSAGYGVSLGDPSLAKDFGVAPDKLYWGLDIECARDALATLGLIHSTRPTDVGDVLQVYTGDDFVVVLEPEGA